MKVQRAKTVVRQWRASEDDLLWCMEQVTIADDIGFKIHQDQARAAVRRVQATRAKLQPQLQEAERTLVQHGIQLEMEKKAIAEVAAEVAKTQERAKRGDVAAGLNVDVEADAMEFAALRVKHARQKRRTKHDERRRIWDLNDPFKARASDSTLRVRT